MKKNVSIFAVLLLSSLAVSCSGGVPYNLEEETQIVVGLEAAYAPFNWTEPSANDFTYPISNQAGTFVDGYDVMMSKSIANYLNKELVIKAIEWDGLIPALSSKQINIIIAGMSPTEVRKKTIAFSDEYYRSEIVMVVNSHGNFVGATSLVDFKGARIVAQRATLYDDVIDQIENVTHQTPLDTYAALTLAVVSGTSDGFVAELPVALSNVAANSNLAIVHFTTGGFQTLEEDVAVSVGMRKIDTALLDKVNLALSQISLETRTNWMNEALNRAPSEE